MFNISMQGPPDIQFVALFRLGVWAGGGKSLNLRDLKGRSVKTFRKPWWSHEGNLCISGGLDAILPL